jgi:hypothetical protein
MSNLRQTLIEHVTDNLSEHVLSIWINPNHEKYREQHRQAIHDMIKHSYAYAGGYGDLGSGSPEESKAIHDDISKSMIKATVRNGNVNSVNLYRDQHGRKSIAAATIGKNPDVTRDEKHSAIKDYIKNKEEDISQKKRNAWGEVSNKALDMANKLNAPKISNDHAEELTGKKIVSKDSDGVTYKRQIGNNLHDKVAVGYPKLPNIRHV